MFLRGRCPVKITVELRSCVELRLSVDTLVLARATNTLVHFLPLLIVARVEQGVVSIVGDVAA
jgi:hypothetical protein